MHTKILLAFHLVLLCLNSKAQSTTFGDTTPIVKPKIQIVFALDATGSMSGLISAAKDKIWSIVNSMTQSEILPDIQVGMVFYRDRGDAFVTKRIQLTDSLDNVYATLMKIRAEGGGDGPESVNQGLNEAVEKMNWNKDTSTYKVVFLIGDFEPHMDYKNDVPYYITCKIAKKKDIVLNTILMGKNAVAEKIWKEIAVCNNGAYVNVNMNVNDIAVLTPQDSLIAILSDQLDDLKYYYGNAIIQNSKNNSKIRSKEMTTSISKNVKAQRAEYNSSYIKTKNKTVVQNELLEDIENKKVTLTQIKEADLPVELKNINAAQRVSYVNEKLLLKDTLQKQLALLIKQRSVYIETEFTNKNTDAINSSLNSTLYESIKVQGNKKKITLKNNAKF